MAKHRRPGLVTETPEAIITMGLAGSVDDAMKEATDNMAQWLEHDYKLGAQEIAEFLGVGSGYHVSEVADRNAGTILKIKRTDLAKLTR